MDNQDINSQVDKFLIAHNSAKKSFDPKKIESQTNVMKDALDVMIGEPVAKKDYSKIIIAREQIKNIESIYSEPVIEATLSIFRSQIDNILEMCGAGKVVKYKKSKISKFDPEIQNYIIQLVSTTMGLNDADTLKEKTQIIGERNNIISKMISKYGDSPENIETIMDYVSDVNEKYGKDAISNERDPVYTPIKDAVLKVHKKVQDYLK